METVRFIKDEKSTQPIVTPDWERIYSSNEFASTAASCGRSEYRPQARRAL
jgi:hypothetical protein